MNNCSLDRKRLQNAITRCCQQMMRETFWYSGKRVSKVHIHQLNLYSPKSLKKQCNDIFWSFFCILAGFSAWLAGGCGSLGLAYAGLCNFVGKCIPFGNSLGQLIWCSNLKLLESRLLNLQQDISNDSDGSKISHHRSRHWFKDFELVCVKLEWRRFFNWQILQHHIGWAAKY